MAEAKKLVPKRRFKEFQNGEAWEERKLNEFSNYYASSLTAGNAKVYGKYRLYDANEMIGYTNEGAQSNDYITIIKDGSGVGRVRLLPKNTSFIGTMGAILSNNSDINFLYCCLENTDFSKHINGATIPHVYYRDYGNDIYFVPSIVEQQRIGMYFKNLDNLITLHQRKLDKIKSMKKAYLYEMFPAEGERKPKRRFKGFTDDWEQRKFGKIFNHLQNNSFSRAQLSYENGEVMNIHYGDVLVEFGECLDISQNVLPRIINNDFGDKYRTSYIENGDVIIADAAEDETVGKCCEIKGLQGEKILSGLHTIPCRPIKNFATGYLGYYMNSDAFHDQLLPLMQGTKVSSISKSALTNTYISFPSSIEEQKKIGKHFEKIDNLITLHQQKLDKLKNLKKSYLNEMFI